jgi:DNA-binding SARP family transcriptional activator/tetratricopeptide (TPR) repeat protein
MEDQRCGSSDSRGRVEIPSIPGRHVTRGRSRGTVEPRLERAAVEFRVLGPLEVSRGGRPLSIAGKPAALLALFLVHANEVVSRDRLIDALWEEQPPETAQKALQVYVSKLRKTLGRDVLLTRGPGYMLQLEQGCLDLERFEELVEQARGAVPETATAKLEEALSLWRGPPFADFAYDRFARSEIARLEELRLEAVEGRIEADLALGRHAELIGELEGLVADHPLRERLRGQLMLALYRSGRQAEALEVYQDTRRVLVEELGIEPTRAVHDLERAILVQDPALDVLPRRVEDQPRAEAEKPPVAPSPTARPGQERKLASVLFADLVGSTTLGEQDPERTRVLIERFYDAMAEEIERVGGTAEKFIGDAVMAAFGVPAAQEDHAERALHAALAMRGRFQALFGDSLSLRIGVNTGEVVAGQAREGGSFVTGDAVNVAARLEQAAAPGEILVGERTVAAVRGAFGFGSSATAEAKGKERGIACRPLLHAVSLTRPRGVAGLRRSFVGRERELELLRAAHERAGHGREPHLVTITGDAGVGKTSLVRELWDWLRAQSPEPLLRAGRCLPYGRGVTYWPLGEVLKEHLGILGSDPPEAVRERLGEREILGLTLGLEVAAELHPLVARERLHEAWVELLDEVVAVRPVVVLVEDLHWAEEPLFDLLDRLLRDVSGPLLLLATARPELLTGRPSWGAGRRNATQLWLEPLSLEEAARVLDELLGSELPAGLRQLVLENVEGNPFFLEELIGALVDRGFLAPDDKGWHLHDLPARFDVPDSVQSVLAARIDLLGAAEKAALQAASVVGRVFWAGPLIELLGGVEADLGVLVERDFIRRRAVSSIAGEREFGFKHALTRDVAYQSLPKARRAHLHAALAAWLERVGEGRDEHAPLLAHHYANSVKPEDLDLAWPGEEDEAERLREKATAWLRRAAELAAGRYALDEQISLLERAVGLEPNEAEQAELWRAIAQANLLKYDQSEFRAATIKAIEGSAGSQAADLYSWLAFWDAFRWGHAEDRELIEVWIGQALEHAAPDSAARARALVARSYCRPEEAEGAAREASAIAERLPDLELRSFAFHALADAVLAQGRYDEARNWAERRLELLDRIGDPDHIADVYWSAIPGYLGRGYFGDARRLAEQHDEVTSRLSPHHRLHGVAFLLEVEELAANWQRIRELTPRAEHAVEMSTPCIHRPRSLIVCALAAACLGDEEETQRLEKAADSLRTEEYGRVVDTRIRLALAHGDLERVKKLLTESAPRKTLIRSTKLAPVAARLDALAALRQSHQVEEEAPSWLQPETYLEPFALRALGAMREDEELIGRAVAGFNAMGLDWHAAQTRALL